MPITRIPYPEPLPVDQNDYVKQNNLLESLYLKTYRPIEIVNDDIVKGTVIQLGGTVYVATSDTAITGVSSDYVKLTPSGDGSTVAPSYVADLTGVTWNQAFNGYYDVNGNMYLFNETIALINGEISAVKKKYIQQDENGNVGIANNLTVKNDVIFPTDKVLFDAINKITFTDGYYDLGAGADWYPPKGVYLFGVTGAASVRGYIIHNDASNVMHPAAAAECSGLIPTDGTTYYWHNSAGGTIRIYYRKYA